MTIDLRQKDIGSWPDSFMGEGKLTVEDHRSLTMVGKVSTRGEIAYISESDGLERAILRLLTN